VIRTVELMRDWFLELEPQHGPQAQLKTLLLLLPDVAAADAPAVIDETQRLLKPAFVRNGLMIGQFHPGPPDAPGLWNEAFRPLHSPVPLLAIRHMVASDLPFLIDDPAFRAAYLDRFADAVPRQYRDRLAALPATATTNRIVSETITSERNSSHDDRTADAVH
jgi:hypothetical protein